MLGKWESKHKLKEGRINKDRVFAVMSLAWHNYNKRETIYAKLASGKSVEYSSVRSREHK